jgi:HEAT repeat protein
MEDDFTTGFRQAPRRANSLEAARRPVENFPRALAGSALSLLEASPTPEHRAAVTELAEKDPTEFVRVKASLALALAGDDKRLPTIARAADSAEQGLVRAAAIEALGLLQQRI